MDFDSGMVHFLMKTKSTYSVQDAFNNLHRLDMSFWKAIVSNGTPRLEIISAPSPVCLRQQPRPEQLQQVLRFVRQNYDWSIVDLGRNLSFLGMSVLDEIDETCLITTLDVPALHQAKTDRSDPDEYGLCAQSSAPDFEPRAAAAGSYAGGNRKDVRHPGVRGA